MTVLLRHRRARCLLVDVPLAVAASLLGLLVLAVGTFGVGSAVSRHAIGDAIVILLFALAMASLLALAAWYAPMPARMAARDLGAGTCLQLRGPFAVVRSEYYGRTNTMARFSLQTPFFVPGMKREALRGQHWQTDIWTPSNRSLAPGLASGWWGRNDNPPVARNGTALIAENSHMVFELLDDHGAVLYRHPGFPGPSAPAPLTAPAPLPPLVQGLRRVLDDHAGARAIPESALPAPRSELVQALFADAVANRGYIDQQAITTLKNLVTGLMTFVPDEDAELAMRSVTGATGSQPLTPGEHRRAKDILALIEDRVGEAMNWEYNVPDSLVRAPAHILQVTRER